VVKALPENSRGSFGNKCKAKTYKMKKQELYKELEMNEFFWGDCFIVARNENIADIIGEIDSICISENRNPLANNWNELSFSDCSDLLFNAFKFDLAYTGCEKMPTEKAEYYRNIITSKFKESETKCYTNWLQNPWKSKNSASWSPITDNTYDMAIVFVDNSKIAFIYFISED
jgi:hypothetical protein